MECRSCGAPVIWVRTQSGKLTPFDRNPDPDGMWSIVVSGDQELAVYAGNDTGPGSRFTSHFATCPDASRWRQ